MTKVEKYCQEKGNTWRCYISYTIKKLLGIPVFSFPPFVTCRADAPCKKICYANLHDYCKNQNAHLCYDDNWYTYKTNEDIIWRGIEGACMSNDGFRYFESGDIPDMHFLDKMVEIAKRQSHCQTVCFTKKYELVNEWIDNNGELPNNLHIIFSAWRGFEMKNPHNLPESHLIFKDGYTTAAEHKVSYVCKGNCVHCKCRHENCFSLKNGEQILLNQH